MKKVAIISSGYLPVPAVLGGAVETLIEKIILSNENNHQLDLTVYSTYNSCAYTESNKYKNTNIIFIKDYILIEKLDLLIYKIVKKNLKNDKQMSFRYILHRVAYIFSVSKCLSKEKYDYLIIENTATLFWVLRLYGNIKRYKEKYVYHLHNEVGNAFGCRKILTNSKRILGVSQYINSTVRKKYSEIDDSKYNVLYNRIDIEGIRSRKSDRKIIRQKYGFKKDDIVCIFVGRLCRDKGIEEVLEAFNLIDNTKIKMLIVGNYYFGTNLVSEFENHLKRLIEMKRNLVTFTGFVANDEIGSFYFASDIAVLPSVWEEPAGLTMIEAMAASLPVITTNSGGIPEYVGKNNAIILEKDHPQFVYNLKNNIEYLAENYDVRRRIGENAFNRVQLFDYDNYAADINALLK